MDNLLRSETSLYLRQHANNPVYWRPWSEAALKEAREKDLPILLSIGYASCHWCHVMAHESFEDSTVAEQMNNHFVNIKVDREERPDLDQVYQLAHYALTSAPGGWPLTVFLDPHTLIPLFTGTYLPPTARPSMLAFPDVMSAVSDAWANHRDELDQRSTHLKDALEAMSKPIGESRQSSVDERPPADELALAAYHMVLKSYDNLYGGFGVAPKFPMTPQLDFLISVADLPTPTFPPSGMVLHSLTCMARGGLFDHVGGGFFRYSVDAKWSIPHFEKMLYDNGLLLAIYVKALAISPDELFEQTIRKTADWLMEEMQLASGAYRSSVDADSPDGEGAFYVWDKEILADCLKPNEYELIHELFGLHRGPNFENRRYHLSRILGWSSLLKKMDLSNNKAQQTLNTALEKLKKVRAGRPMPIADDKVICAWNALVIKGMVKASEALREPAYMKSALDALDFIRNRLWQNGTLYSVHDQGQAKPWGFLDDYACLLDALLALLEVNWQPDHAGFAATLADTALEKFFDEENGGFFFTPRDHEKLISQLKPMTDDVLPSGNLLMAKCLLQLGHLLGNQTYTEAADRTLDAGIRLLGTEGIRSPGLAKLLRLLEQPELTVVLSGISSALASWRDWCRKNPSVRTFVVPSDLQDGSHLPFCLNSTQPPDEVQAFVCSAHSCAPPVNTVQKLDLLVKERSAR